MKWALLIIPLLLVAGCVEQGTPTADGQQQQGSQSEPVAVSTPEATAKAYMDETYVSSDRTVYSEHVYTVQSISPTTAKIIVRFKQTVTAPTYTQIQVREQEVVTELRDGVWVATTTPPSKVINQQTV